MKKRRMKKNIWAALLTAGLLGGILFPAGTARAAETEAVPYIDISTDTIRLSPQAAEAKLNVAAKNMPEGTKLTFFVADEAVCSVEWAGNAYTQLLCRRGETPGSTVITVFAAENPGIARQITVFNMDAADSYVYEGDGSYDIYGLNMAAIPYAVHAVSAEPNGYFGLIYSNASGEMYVLANKAGAYEGVTTIPQGANATTLHILATGHWRIEIAPLTASAAPSQSGSGNTVTGIFRGDDTTHQVYCANWAGEGNYIVWLYDITNNTKQLLANGVGTYGKIRKDVTLYSENSYYLSVQSEGNWLVEFRK